MQAINRLSFFAFSTSLLVLSCTKDKQNYDESYIQFTTNELSYNIPFFSDEADTIMIELSTIGTSAKADQEISIKADSIGDSLKESGLLSFPQTINFTSGDYKTVFPFIIQSSKVVEGFSANISLLIEGEKIATNYNNFELQLKKEQFIDIFTGSFSCEEDQYHNNYPVLLHQTVPASDTILIENFWDFSLQDHFVKLIVNKESQNIVLLEQAFIDAENNEYILAGEGTLNDDQSFTINYIMKKSDGAVFEEGVQVYTPNS